MSEKTPLGRTGLRVSRLGVACSYGAPASCYEQAFERGINYFYWGSMRDQRMGEAIRRIVARYRDQLVVVVQSYARLGFWVRRSTEKALRVLGLDCADVLLLGWYNRVPPPRVVRAALALKERGLVRHLALSSHRRTLFPELSDEAPYDVWHVRYNAVHRGAEREVFPVLAGRDVTTRPGVVTYTSTRWGHLCDPGRTPPGEHTPTGTDCYRFALSHPGVDVAMAGPANEAQMRQAVAALEQGRMDEEELAWMRRVGDHIYGRDWTSKLRD